MSIGICDGINFACHVYARKILRQIITKRSLIFLLLPLVPSITIKTKLGLRESDTTHVYHLFHFLWGNGPFKKLILLQLSCQLKYMCTNACGANWRTLDAERLIHPLSLISSNVFLDIRSHICIALIIFLLSQLMNKFISFSLKTFKTLKMQPADKREILPFHRHLNH